ncbi:MAG: hypothetical protein U0271_40495 [Polyangiaceae bacterium]
MAPYRIRGGQGDEFVNARRYPPVESSVIVVLGLRADGAGLLCVDL